MRVFHVRINGCAAAFAKPDYPQGTVKTYLHYWVQIVSLRLRGYRRNWIGPCWRKGTC
jgi:hypothetical protein